MPEEFVNVRYMVDDVDRAVAFYTTHFGFTLGRDAPRVRAHRRGARDPHRLPHQGDLCHPPGGERTCLTSS